mgnify:CR=1 FL=1
MKKTESLPSTSALFTCTCGAMPYDAEKRPKGKVGLARYRKSSRYAKDGGWSVVCTRCGRVGERGSTQIDAKARWNAKRYKYGPLKGGEKNERYTDYYQRRRQPVGIQLGKPNPFMGGFYSHPERPDETQLRHRDPRGVHGPAQG